jgi:tetratricopeptide (TPR) repeat protein
MKAAAVAAILVALASAPHAEPDDLVTAAAAADERALLTRLDKDELIKARTDAEAILEKTPDSLVATWAMTRVQHTLEGNFARALFYVHRAQALRAARFASSTTWDRRLALEEFDIDRDMDRNSDAVAVLDAAEQRGIPMNPEDRIWSLFKIPGRRDEARRLARQVMLSENPEERRLALNDIFALEFETHDRRATDAWSKQMVEVGAQSCVMLRNAAGGSFMMFRLREAEEIALRAHEVANQSCWSGGYDELAGLYLVEGEFEKAVAAFKSLAARALDPRKRQFSDNTKREILADLLLVLGKVDDGYRLAAQVYAQPERLGMISTDWRRAALERTMRYWIALQVKLASDAEESAVRTFGPSSWHHAMLVFEHWAIGRELIQLFDDDDLLVVAARPNMDEAYDLQPFKTMQLVDVVGLGVMRKAVAIGRRIDTDVPAAAAYFDLYDAELDYRAGDLARAIAGADSALPHLQKEEALFRWRTLAWEADALRAQGKLANAAPLYHEVLQKFPSVFRLLGVAVPVSIHGDGSALAGEASSRIARSPRFTVTTGAPFAIAVSAKGARVELCLTDANGYQFACATGGDGSDAVVSALDAFHAAAFSPKINVDQQDLQSLDGSPQRASADAVLKGILGP